MHITICTGSKPADRRARRHWRTWIGWIARTVLVTMALPALAAPDAPAMKPPEGYRLVWADEFDQDGLPDAKRWVWDTFRNREGWFNNEKQYYAAERAQNAVVRDGRLVITARREALREAPDWGGQAYTSARLITRGKAEWTYGYFEISARMPCGRGTWPALWTLGSGGRWPDDGELDIMEHMGQRPEQVSSAVHVRAGHAGQAVTGMRPLASACTQFHRYQMHWTPEGVTFGVDGFAHLRFPRLSSGRDAWPFDQPQFLVMNLAIGGDLGGPVDDRIFPVAMEVEYVRVWQRSPVGRR
jgi:beta-glucanase (GH16 family)